MKFASLGSGSEGNALLIASSAATSRSIVMVDCGFTVREAERRLGQLGVDPSEIDALFVTHEHQDHIGGVYRFARRFRTPVWLSHGTWQATSQASADIDIRLCRDGVDIAIGNLIMHPYTVPHDAREPLQYVVRDARAKLGVLTDAGHRTLRIIEALNGCDALILECNHDRAMLETSTYPLALRNRISGGYGHLANEVTADILQALDRSRLKLVVAAHLSRQNNTPQLAQAALASVVGQDAISVIIADQDAGFDWIEIGE